MTSRFLALVGLAASIAISGCKREAPSPVGAREGETGIPANPTVMGDLSGAYTITSASNPGGAGSYGGKVTLTKAGGSYRLAWSIPGAPAYSGVGVPVGNVLGVGWGMGSRYGVAIYQARGGTLKGLWTTAANPKVGTENLEGPPGLDGTYQITSAAGPDGKSYGGRVTIKPNGQVFDVTWTLPNDSYSGVGIREGDLLVVGWGEARKGAGVVSYRVEGKNLVGRWGTPGTAQLGSESLAKE